MLESDEDVRQVRLRVDAILLTGGKEGEEPREVFAGLVVADEEVVFPSQGDGAQPLLGCVVV